MKTFPARCRTASKLSESAHEHLGRFAIATILSVGLLALARPTEAEIVHTHTNITIGPNASYNLDLNNDGVTDFTLTITAYRVCDPMPPVSCFWLYYSFVETPASGNGAEGSPPTNLVKGDQIGPSQSFYGGTGTIECCGNPIGLKGYLGLSFQIDGETHYGWAKISVNMKTGVVTLVSYAYETIANMPINAGQF
jgi:hypothetical protein